MTNLVKDLAMLINNWDAGRDATVTDATDIDTHGPSLRVVAAVSVALTAFAIVVHIIIMRQFEALGVFAQYNVLFDTDPSSRLNAISHNWPPSETIHPALLNFVHPYFAYYFGPMIRIMAKGLTFVGLTGQSEPTLRVALGVLVMPIVSGLQTGALCVLLFALRYTAYQVALIAGLGIISFSSLIFGSIPDHFPVTNLAVTLLLLLATATLTGGRSVRLRHWVFVGVFAAGTTITNIVIFSIVHWCVGLARRRSVWSATITTFVLSLSIFTVVVATGHTMAKLNNVKPAPQMSQFVQEYLDDERSSHWEKLDRAATAIGNAVTPAYPETKDLSRGDFADALRQSTGPIKFAFTLKTAPSIFSTANPLGLLAFLGMLVGGVCMILKGGPWRSIALISIAIVIFNIVFHSIWGSEPFLYSQHWITPSLLLLSGVFHLTHLTNRIVAAMLALYVLTITTRNISIVTGMIEQLASARG